ncbi:MAG TPA: TldD/PmbA family protein [Actinomycetota bacterium]|nr:TldD/PmbA family protein [Actinomycetota bacterium]
MLEIAQQAVEAARRAGADVADARVGTDETEAITVRDGAMEGVDRSTSTGIGIRVLVGGRWGFAATARLDEGDIEATAALAVRIAHAAARLPGDAVRLSPVEPVRDAWATPVGRDPFSVPLDEKIDLLQRATGIARAQPGVTYAEAFLDLFRRTTAFASSDGAAIDQTITNAGAGLAATAVGDDDVQRRSYPDSFRGHHRAAGWEHIEALDLPGEAERVGREAVELLHAPGCPSTLTTLVLDANQMELQIHESVGHPTELDRVLGMELAFAGGSFLTPDDLGHLRYASPLVTIVADATLPEGLGTFGYDDEGVPAQRTPLIEDGILAGFLTNRETAPTIGAASNATARADGWTHLPLIRMTNISIEPREGTLDEIVGDTADGIFMSTNTSWSIDDHRINFQFGCEYARRIEGGKLTDLYKNPNYAGITPEFWGSCDAVGGPASFVVYGTPNCGKGQPGQTARVGHGAAPARFRGVQVGVRG